MPADLLGIPSIIGEFAVASMAGSVRMYRRPIDLYHMQ
jgi:hypothetical protein